MTTISCRRPHRAGMSITSAKSRRTYKPASGRSCSRTNSRWRLKSCHRRAGRPLGGHFIGTAAATSRWSVWSRRWRTESRRPYHATLPRNRRILRWFAPRAQPALLPCPFACCVDVRSSSMLGPAATERLLHDGHRIVAIVRFRMRASLHAGIHEVPVTC